MDENVCIAGSQPCLEALREMLSLKVTYDRKRHTQVDTKPATFLAACTTPGQPGEFLGLVCHGYEVQQ